MTHDHTHELSLACMDCVKQRVRERDRLLAFVKELAHESCYEKYENENAINWAAFQLLKELGFENEK